ncbi:unnamed protein product [Polarella glacialis]|uniref:Uncharacterized protein n=1 Tax=Polarella glacialis TaxID=89957 RepID=A0A813LDJ8_POLGL|nr:unnamed protein product [Polarella glacialis]
MLGKAFIIATLCVSVAHGFVFTANCVPGITVANFGDSNIFNYSTILRHLLPARYGDLVAVAADDGADCLAAQNAINENRVLLHDVPDKYHMTVLDPSEEALSLRVSQMAVLMKSYLYVFRTANFNPDRFSGACPSGSTVSSLNQLVKTVGFVAGLKKAVGNLTYLYVFENCKGNRTTQWWV